MMHLRLSKYVSPLSPLLVVTDENDVLRALEYSDLESRMRQMLTDHYSVFELQGNSTPRAIADALDSYFAGDLAAVDELPTATNGTDFQRKVWKHLRKIEAGTPISYGELAARIGRPSASRAVGAANGSNPIEIVVPCHRVIGASGSLTGYGGGLPRKRWLLDHERRHSTAACVGEPARATV